MTPTQTEARNRIAELEDEYCRLTDADAYGPKGSALCAEMAELRPIATTQAERRMAASEDRRIARAAR